MSLQHYDTILPTMEKFLKTGAWELGAEAEDELAALTAQLQTKKSRKNNENSTVPDETPYAQLRERIVVMLGAMAARAAPLADLAAMPTGTPPPWMSWDRVTHLRYVLPLADMRPTLVLDSLLPRLIELATDAGDRQTKIAACELLHSTVLFMVGDGAQQQRDRASMVALYKHVFPAVLILACSAESIAKQLFEPLVS